MKWLLLTFRIITQVTAATCMKLSNGFTVLLPTMLTFVITGISFAIFILALKYFDLSFAYALWSGLGILFISTIGILYFHESVNALKIVSIIVIIVGVIGLNLADLVTD